jgi:Na+-translocating ferredoxin:NAD+ oxidoreductase subunit C
LVVLHDAIVSNKPHIEQYVYVGGGAMKAPAILKARIGTTIGDLIEECGGFSGQPDRICINDPYRGVTAADLDVPLTRSTRAVLALTRHETKPAPVRPCNRCGNCLRACPEGLHPYLLNKLLLAGRTEEAFAAGLGRCTFCGACAYTCWSRIPLVERFKSVCLKDETDEKFPDVNLAAPHIHDWHTTSKAAWICSATLVPVVIASVYLYGMPAAAVWLQQ